MASVCNIADCTYCTYCTYYYTRIYYFIRRITEFDGIEIADGRITLVVWCARWEGGRVELCEYTRNARTYLGLYSIYLVRKSIIPE